MSANWVKFDGIPTEARTVVLDGPKVLDGEWTAAGNALVQHPNFQGRIAVDLDSVLAPLGKYGEVLFKQGEFTTVRDSLKRYWSHAGSPSICVDLISGKEEETGNMETMIGLRTKVVASGVKVDDRLERVIDGVRKSELGADRVVVGYHREHIELQFLAKRLRQEVQKDDFVDCGLFVSMNGKVQVSAGLNRLVCTNGLTRRMMAWNRDEFNFDPALFEQAKGLMAWFRNTPNQKIKHTREISVVLDLFPPTFVARFWKKWSEKVELSELTWFMVIDDLTRAVNSNLGDLRYRTLAVSERIEGFAGRCHSCAAEIARQ